MNSTQKGFTLIEGMIVLGIIALLAALALPMYQDYINETQIMRVYKEVSNLRSPIEISISRGREPTTNPADNPSAGSNREYIGFDMTRSNLISAFTIAPGTLVPTSTSAYDLTATLGQNANSQIVGVQVLLQRSGLGIWQCTIRTNSIPGWKDQFAPTFCAIL